MTALESMPWWLDIFVFLGFAASLFSVGCVIKELCEHIEYQINRSKYKRKMRHRFDGPPLAKCYCRDCKYWYERYDVNTSGKCNGFIGKYTADDYFCKGAKPRKTDPDNEDSQ